MGVTSRQGAGLAAGVLLICKGLQTMHTSHSLSQRYGALSNDIEEVLSDIRSTEKSRFTGHRRLTQRSRASATATVLASLVVVGLSIAALTLPDSEGANVASIIGSVSVLCFTLLEAGSQYSVQAERMHACGLELSALRRRFRGDLIAFDESDQFDELADMHEDLCVRYDQVLSRHDENHLPTDYHKFQAEDVRNNCLTRLQRLRYRIYWFGAVHLPYFLFIVVVILIAFSLALVPDLLGQV